MVVRSYLLDKPNGPSAPKVFFDQKIVPIMINAAGAVEGLLERVAVQARGRPLATLGAALGSGALVALFMNQGRGSVATAAKGSPLNAPLLKP